MNVAGKIKYKKKRTTNQPSRKGGGGKSIVAGRVTLPWGGEKKNTRPTGSDYPKDHLLQKRGGVTSFLPRGEKKSLPQKEEKRKKKLGTA